MSYSTKFSNTRRKKRTPKYRWVIISVIALLLIGGALIYLYHHRVQQNATSPTATSKKMSTPRPTTDKTKPPAPAPSSGSGSDSGQTPPPSTPPGNDVTLTKPYGSFVSNHTPGQNGSPLAGESLCNTSPNATCVITFTKDGVTKSLPAKTADSSGATYWQWQTPQSIGLTAGNWTVAAVATLGQQTASTSDPTPLQVLP